TQDRVLERTREHHRLVQVAADGARFRLDARLTAAGDGRWFRSRRRHGVPPVAVVPSPSLWRGAVTTVEFSDGDTPHARARAISCAARRSSSAWARTSWARPAGTETATAWGSPGTTTAAHITPSAYSSRSTANSPVRATSSISTRAEVTVCGV